MLNWFRRTKKSTDVRRKPFEQLAKLLREHGKDFVYINIASGLDMLPVECLMLPEIVNFLKMHFS